MIQASSLGQIFGVRVRLHYTWMIAFILAIAIVITHFSEAVPLWQRVLLGVAAGLLFLMSVSIREFILRLLSISKGMPVKHVTLYVFGGASKLTTEVADYSLDLLLAVTGLLSNLLIVILFWVAYIMLMKAGNVIIATLTQWLSFLYLLLTLFHFLPGFPLDGGRGLRALLWKITGDYYRATIITSWIGWGIGILCILGGIVLLILTRQWFTGLLLAMVGLVLQSAASVSRRQAILYETLQNATASDIMSREFPFITPQISIDQLVRGLVTVTGQRYFIIADDTRLQGVVTIRNIKKLSKARWSSTTVGAIMTPASKVRTASPQQSATSLLEQMEDFDIDYMPVLENGTVIGIVARDSLNRLGMTRSEIGR